MGLEAVCGCGEKHAPSKGAVFGDGGRAARDRKGVGHGAPQVPGADQKAPKGAGDGRPSSPDRLPAEGKCGFEDIGS